MTDGKAVTRCRVTRCRARSAGTARHPQPGALSLGRASSGSTGHERTRREAHGTRCMQKRTPSRAHGRALPCRAAPGLGCSGTGYRCPDRPSRASWPRPVPPEQPRRLERVAARARPAQRRLPSSRRRLSGRVVGKTGCRLTPGRASRCCRVGYGRTLVRRLGSAGGWPALSTSAHRRVVWPRPRSARRSAGRLAYAAAIKLDSVLADADRQPRSVGLRSVAWMAELLARCATCASEATKRRGRD